MRIKRMCLILGLVLITGLAGGEKTNESRVRLAHRRTVPLTDAEQRWLKAHPVVYWGADPDWPPFSCADKNGKMVGVDVDITRRVADRVGMNVQLVSAESWPELYKKAEAGKVDFLSGTARTEERLEHFNFTSPYGTFPVVIITKNDAAFFTSVTDLALMTIAAARDHVITTQLKRDFPTARFVLCETVDEALNLVSRGKVDASVSNLAAATRVIRLSGLTNLKISGVTHYEFPLHFAVRKDAPELTSILNKGLAAVSYAEQERIYATHLTPDVAKAKDWGAWRRRAIYSALIGAGLVSLVMIWNRCLAHQVIQRRQAENALRVARDRLEHRTHELDDRVAEVEHLNTDLKMANHDLESFTGSVSHDLRAPLRRICAFAELLQVEAGSHLQGKGEKMMSSIVKESTRMNLLIHDLLEFARIGRADLRMRPVNMQHLVHSIIEDFQSQLRDRAVDWKVGDLCEVRGDENLLRCAMTNLIDNALKYSQRSPDTHIRIDMLPEPTADGEHVFFVQDNGCGFNMDDAKDLFAPFTRLHSTNEYEGTGIGLANVQKIILRHGGSIWYESERGKGAVFFFTLPCAEKARFSINPQMPVVESNGMNISPRGVQPVKTSTSRF